MKEIVEHILQEETEARSKLDAARTQATSIIAQAQEETRASLETKISDAQCIVQKDMEALQKRFLSEKEKILQATKEEAVLLHQKHAHRSREIAHTRFQALIVIE